MTSIKCVVCGDGAVGKTCMIMSYTKNTFPEEHVPTVFDNDSTTMLLDGQAISLGIWDTAGQAEFDTIRPLSYPQTDIFLVCFAVDSLASYNNIQSKWLPEIRHYCPGVPYLLVGLKSDLRGSDKANNLITSSKGDELAHEIDACAYLECSALTQEGLKQVFDEAARHALQARIPKQPKPKKDCIIC